MDTYVYKVKNNIYINLTNRCTNRCGFCIRTNCSYAYSYDLWLKKEPSAKKVIEDLKKFEDYREAVFCGYGEPTIKLKEIVEISGYLKSINKPVRLNTNGQGNVINGFDITPKLKGLVDSISISLNASNEKDYQKLCNSEFKNAYAEVINFSKLCVKNFDTTLTVLDFLGKAEIEKCKKIADDLGAKFRVRAFEKNI